MGLLKDRSRFSTKGLGQLEIKEVLPSNDAAYQKLGYLGETGLSDISEMEEIADETGAMANAIEKTRAARIKTQLMQVGLDEIAYITGATNKIHSIRYSGLANETMFQFFAMEQGKIIRQLDRQFVNQKQSIPFEFLAFQQEPTTFTTPLYHMAEAKGRIYTEGLQLWCNPRWLGAPERSTAKLFDITGFARHGSLNSDYAAIWATSAAPESKLTFDGVNDQVDFGNILNDDASGDMVIEMFVRVLAANGTKVNIFSKKNTLQSTAVGFGIVRDTSNAMYFDFADGTNRASAGTPGSTILQNVWNHVAVTVDRNGTAQMYVNGAASGSAVSVASVGSATNALSMFLGRDGAGTFANIDIGTLRIYRFAADSMPTTMGSILATNYSAEKIYYGL